MWLLRLIGVSGQTLLFFPDKQMFNQEHFRVHLDPGTVFQPYMCKISSYKARF